MLYADHGKLARAEAMYCRVLQGYEKVLGPQFPTSHLLALSTIFPFSGLHARTVVKTRQANLTIELR